MRDSIVLFINGQRHKLGYDDAVVTLADFLRRRAGLVGTKIVCNEGDCGACSVLVGRRSVDGGTLRYQAMDACILFVFQLDRAHIVTIEGLRDGDHLTPVQQAMVQCHGSQCGFCTPGFVVTMHGMVEAGIDLNDASLRYGLSGNLCRCTGYSQIMDAGKSVEAAAVPRISQLYPDKPILGEFVGLGDEPVQIEGDQTVFVPRTLQQAVEFKASFPAATIVSGATDYGVLHNHGRTASADLLCLTSVEGFDSITTADDVLRIGGGATWTQIESHVEGLFPPYHVIVTRFGSPQIRNLGTLAGNLASGSPIADSIPFHLVMDSQLRLVSSRSQREVALNEFYTGYRQNIMADDELIAEVTTPLLAQDERLAVYKISKRRDMDISTLTLGLWIKLRQEMITDARLAIGGVGPTVSRITASEQYLVGKTLTESTMQLAGEIARDQISPWSDVRGGAGFRLQLAENLLLKAYHEFAGEMLTQPSF